MPSRPTSKKALPKRSRGIPVKLARKTCLRCSKRISDEPTHRCGYKDFQKCGACARKHKECEPIPRKFIPEVNHLLTLARDLAPAEEGFTARQDELDEVQKRYTKRVQAYIRKREKRGLKHRPTNTVEAVMLLVDQVERLNETMAQILDVKRYDAKLDPIVDDSDGSESDSASAGDEEE